MSMLVNGSPTEDFVIGKGLRQGDPLSPFLFLLVVKGLSRLMRKAVDIGRFTGFKVTNDLHFHTLQFADDTVIVGEGNWDNLWALKTVLQSFEIVSGLNINFFKSKLYGINLDDSFLSTASAFLHCEVDIIPFRFLGILVGANPRRRSTWSPILESMKNRLNRWNGHNFSIGGRVTLINSAPKCVLQDLVAIQKKVLWGGGSDSKKNCLVTWDTNKSLYPNGSIADMGFWLNERWVWNFLWSEELPIEQQQAAADLQLLLFDVQPKNKPDGRRWIPNQSGEFSVNSAYSSLLSRGKRRINDEFLVDAIWRLWRNNVPSKISIFGWKFLLARLPTRAALAKKGSMKK
ncbi:uncharacterized protein LOC123904295 [Trifolium pratense]|uniref:uncharacterized protein LOC123904295 n=1 Tax=Trifolium pratense TaxID=57577 RepID=UPI001E6958C0|nr:uncharacterized protein LOC123904295 [Trifolium pratense]